MGFYLRKSIKVGPFRFNLSGAGVGVSAGIRGFRIGAGPRGNYVHVGRRGIYYRATIPASAPGGIRTRSHGAAKLEIPAGTHEPLQEIESADVCQIVDSSSADLLAELNGKHRRLRLWPFAVVGAIFFVAVGVIASWPGWLVVLLLIFGASAISAAAYRDILGKTVVLFYDLDSEIERTYHALHEAAEQLAGSSRTWRIEAQGRVRDRKYHAGASSLVRRRAAFIRKAQPPYVKTNVETIVIGGGAQTLHFFPDRLLVYAIGGVGAVSYQNLELAVRSGRFIEDGGVPSDAKIVDRTWKYVNKNGGPDRRFKDNRQLPVCLYDELALGSSSGLNELVQVSRCGVAEAFANAVRRLASALPTEKSQPEYQG